MAAKMAATVLLLVGLGLVSAEGGFGVETDSLPSLYTPYCPTGHLISQNASISLKEIFEPSRVIEQFPDIDSVEECYSRCCELASCNVASYLTYKQGKVCVLVYCVSKDTCKWQPYSTGYAAFITREEPVNEEMNTNTQTGSALVGSSETDQTETVGSSQTYRTGTQTDQHTGSVETSQTGTSGVAIWQVGNRTPITSQDVTTADDGDNNIWWLKNDNDDNYDDYDWSSEERDEDDWLYESDEDDWSDDYDSESDEDDGDDDGYSNPKGKGNSYDSDENKDLDNHSDYKQYDYSYNDDYEWDISKDKDMGLVNGNYDDYDGLQTMASVYEDGKPVVVTQHNSSYFVVVILLVVLLCLGGLLVVGIHYVAKRRTMAYNPLVDV